MDGLIDRVHHFGIESLGDLLERSYQRTPRAVRDLHPSGYNDVLVHNMMELEDLNPATDAARISASIGKRKKDLMLEKASELGIKVLNK